MLSLLLFVTVATSSFVVQLNAQDVLGCNSSWVLMPNMGIYGGVAQENATTEDGCREACYVNTTCQGVDWNPTNADGNKCYLHFKQGPTTAFQGVNHWTFNRTAPCAGACGVWTSYASMGIYGGTEQPSITTEDACKTACVNDGNCAGVDWNPSNGLGHLCYLQFSHGPLYNASGITHWEYNSTAGCQLACGTWSPTSNTGVYGGFVEEGVMTEKDCRLACIAKPNCTGVDWNPQNDDDERCFLQYGSTTKYSSNGITHWEFSRTGTCNVDCLFAFTESSNTGIPGGLEQPGIGNVTECKQACVLNQSCVGIDWSPNNGPGHQCYLHSTTGTRFIWMGVFHYDLDTSVCNPPIVSTTTTVTTVTTTVTTTTNTPANCRWYRSPNSNIFGGTQDPSDTLNACLLSCQAISGCVAVDWAANNPSGAKCYRHVTQLGRVAATWGVDHYDLNCDSSANTALVPAGLNNNEMATTMEGGQKCWSVSIDNRSLGGDLHSEATDIGACEAACLNTGSCKAVDWDRNQNTSNACYVFTTALITYPAIGVDHYEYNC